MDSPAVLRWVMGAIGLLPLLAFLAGLMALAANVLHATTVPLSIAPAVLTGVGFTWFWLGPGRRRAARPLIVLTALLTLAAVALPQAPLGFFLLWAYPLVLLGFTLRSGRAFLAQAVLYLIAALALVTRLPQNPSPYWAPTMITLLVLVGTIAVAIGELQRANVALRAAHAEIERLAVEEERQRFARDLHDLLGHTLSLILVKLQVARKSLPDGMRADHELADLQRLARTALDDVREAVGSYRQPTLLSELSGARIAADAAGILLVVDNHAGPLPSAVEAVLAWGLREAVTNMLRHSAASECRISLTSDQHQAHLEVTDNGNGGSPEAESGLRTLRERVESARGRLCAGNHAGGGFAVGVHVPLAPGRPA
ncbi:sensor histidine kinase [Amycolatopsis alkalitolerans]|uniref:sensor histidine kinase n=1 Tax=Amycolatopsis alkalitolerans TaxID=2547244 RepID=UPI00135ADC38|nr:sensor histidine kinase [Amycolatopsis alkalitolerans]